MDLDLAVVRDEEPIAVLCTLDDAFHLTSIELPFRVGVTAQAPQDHLSNLRVTVLRATLVSVARKGLVTLTWRDPLMSGRGHE